MREDKVIHKSIENYLSSDAVILTGCEIYYRIYIKLNYINKGFLLN